MAQPHIKWDTNRLKGLVNRECRERMEASVQLLVGAAKRICPVDTGNLKGSLIGEISADGLRGWYGSYRPWRGENPVPYAMYVEDGRYAKPYLRPPLRTEYGQLKQIWSGAQIRVKENPWSRVVTVINTG